MQGNNHELALTLGAVVTHHQIPFYPTKTWHYLIHLILYDPFSLNSELFLSMNSKQVSWRTRVLVVSDWTRRFIFGRDSSRI
jgi:hypothetical protein